MRFFHWVLHLRPVGNCFSRCKCWQALVIALSCCVMVSNSCLAAIDRAYDKELCLVIDANKSMQANDPENTWKKAVKLIIKTLSSTSRAGIWTFGDGAKKIVPLGKINRLWQQNALAQIEAVVFKEDYRDLSGAIQACGVAWEGSPQMIEHHILLITDGDMNISDGKKANAAEKKRLLNAVIPSLSKRNVVISIVGLADKVDQSFLAEMAKKTKGDFYYSANASTLAHNILSAFYRAMSIPVDINNNAFLVEDEVEHLILMMHRKKPAESSVLVTPDGQAISADSPNDEITWMHRYDHDVVVVDYPIAGVWHLKNVDIENCSAYIQSPIYLLLSPIPSMLFPGESVTLHATVVHPTYKLFNDGFMKNLRFEMAFHDADPALSTQTETLLTAPESKGDKFQQTLNIVPEIIGAHSISVTAKSGSIVRRKTADFEVVAFPLDFKQTFSQETNQLFLEYTIDEKVVSPESLEVSFEQFTLPISQVSTVTSAHKFQLKPLKTIEKFKVRLKGKTINDRPFAISSPEAIIEFPAENAKPNRRLLLSQAEEKPAVSDREQAVSDREQAPKEISSFSLLLMILTGSIVLLTFGLIALLFFYRKASTPPRGHALFQSPQEDKAAEEK